MNENQPNNRTTTYRASPRYRLMAAIGLLLTVAFGWSVVAPVRRGEGLAWDALFFLLVVIGFTLWALYQTLGAVEIAERKLTLHRPLVAPHTVEFRQLFSVTESGRVGGRSISLVYHPLRADGLIDLDDARSLVLPELTGQDELLAWIEARVPS